MQYLQNPQNPQKPLKNSHKPSKPSSYVYFSYVYAEIAFSNVCAEVERAQVDRAQVERAGLCHTPVNEVLGEYGMLNEECEHIEQILLRSQLSIPFKIAFHFTGGISILVLLSVTIIFDKVRCIIGFRLTPNGPNVYCC